MIEKKKEMEEQVVGMDEENEGKQGNTIGEQMADGEENEGIRKETKEEQPKADEMIEGTQRNTREDQSASQEETEKENKSNANNKFSGTLRDNTEGFRKE